MNILNLEIFLGTILICILGPMIDARMWGNKEEDPQWLKDNTDYIWLGGWNILQPLMWFTLGFFAGIDYITNFIHHLLYYYTMILLMMFGNSVFWDAIFFKIESNVWVRQIRLWTKLCIPFFKISSRTFNRIFSIEDNSLVIGFNTVEDMKRYNIFRIIFLLVIIYTYILKV